jgi:hypothetical protein
MYKLINGDTIEEVRKKDGSLIRFNMDAHYRSYSAKKKVNKLVESLPVPHPLTGKKVIYKKNKTEYVIQAVHKHWYAGYYYVALLRDNHNSHSQAYIANINSIADLVLDEVEKFNINYILV